MKKQMSYYLKKLEEAGIDTSKFNLELNGVVMSVEDALKSKQVVGETYIFDRNGFEHSVAIATMRAMMFVQAEYPYYKDGINAYVRKCLKNKEQFYDLLNMAKLLSKLEKDPSSEEFKVLSNIYTFDVYKAYAEDYQNRVMFKGSEYKESLLEATLIVRAHDTIDSYKMLYDVFKNWSTVYVALPNETPKCEAWKDAYKACSAYFTLSYLVKKGAIKDMSLDGLNGIVDVLAHGEKNNTWRLYKMLESHKEEVEKLWKEMNM